MDNFKNIEDFFNGDFENIDFSFLDKDDFENKKNKQKEEKESLQFALNFAATLYPNDKKYSYAKEAFPFTHKISSLMAQKYDNQTYEELTNMIEQFDSILNDYLKEKGLKYE